jgi:hypothetical protein
MANGFPAKTSYQNGRPLGAPELAAIGAALNESAPAKVTAAGQIPVGIGLNEIAALAAPLASGSVLRSNLDLPGKMEWVNAGIDVYTASQGSALTLSSSAQDIPGLSASVTTKHDDSLIVVLLGGGYCRITGSGSDPSIIASVDGSTLGGMIWTTYLMPTDSYVPVSGLHFRNVPTAKTLTVKLTASQFTPNAVISSTKMVILVI